MNFTIDVPSVSDEALETWKTFLHNDALNDGGTASVLLRLNQHDDLPVKVTCCAQVTIVEFLGEIEFAIEKSGIQPDPWY